MKKICFIISIFLILLSFILDGFLDVFIGYKKIILSTSILTTDYLSFGFGATLFNAGLMLLCNLIFLSILKIKVSGPVFAGLMSILGFSFFGKNIINTLPISLGVYLYSLVSKTSFKNVIITYLFSSGLLPIVSYLMFSDILKLYFSIPLAILVGVIAGFIIAPLAAHTIKFHNGYNLYNVGFTMGIISMMFYGILYVFNIPVDEVNTSCTDYHYKLLTILIGIVLLFLITSLICNRKAIKEYPNLLKKTGRLITDFTRDFDISLVMLNIAFMGILSLIMIFTLNIKLDGLTFGAIMLVMGFSAFGVHLKNSIPVIVGALISYKLLGYVGNTYLSYSVLFFVVGLSPICGKYGIIAGLCAGFIHVIILPICLNFQGGFDLYNNGFAAGFVALTIIPIIENLRRD